MKAEEFAQKIGREGILGEGDFLVTCMIEFTKFHVEQALKAASEKAHISTLKKSQYSKKSRWKKISKKEEIEGVNIFIYEIQYKVCKKSILNAYPLSNIK